MWKKTFQNSSPTVMFRGTPCSLNTFPIVVLLAVPFNLFNNYRASHIKLDYFLDLKPKYALNIRKTLSFLHANG